jgi:ABC-type bacteriocin/lantibiotic exporter with double-glycine peptidase domain
MMKTTLEFKEAILNTLLATTIGVPINFVLASIAVHLQWTAIEITIYFTLTFFWISVYRNMRIRRFFRENYEKE